MLGCDISHLNNDTYFWMNFGSVSAKTLAGPLLSKLLLLLLLFNTKYFYLVWGSVTSC